MTVPHIRFVITVLCAVGLLAEAATGQRVTIQLPTFHQFSLSTTVVVPDRGRLFLGGISHSRQQRSTIGAPLLPRRHRVASY